MLMLRTLRSLRGNLRALGLAIVIPALIALARAMLLVALATKLESRGPVFIAAPEIRLLSAL